MKWKIFMALILLSTFLSGCFLFGSKTTTKEELAEKTGMTINEEKTYKLNDCEFVRYENASGTFVYKFCNKQEPLLVGYSLR
jgi:outer membrane lipoprotein-sorting protein